MRNRREKIETVICGLFSVWLTWVSFTLVEQKTDIGVIKTRLQFLLKQKPITHIVPGRDPAWESSEEEIDNG